jgi:outer membrane protein assembly factor BamD
MVLFDVMSWKRVGFALVLALQLAACSGSGRVRYESPAEAFEKGMEAYEKGKNRRAIEYLQGVFDFGRTHEFAADAQLFLARAYARNREYMLAANEYNRFVQIFRQDPRVPDAEFENAMTYYARSPEFELDQTETERAVRQFQLFINRYPTHPKASEAVGMIAELREKLAHKRHEAARLYARRRLHEAAALTFESVFDEYPDTEWADDALFGAIQSYILYAEQSIIQRQRERYQSAIDNYERLAQLFPDSPHLPLATELHEQALARRDDIIVAN